MGRINQLAEKTTLNSTDVIAVDAGAGGNTNKMTGANLARQLKTLGNYQEKLTFDSAPTAGSTNPVTSGGVKTALDGKQNTLTFDAAPTAGSTNPVTSGGVANAIAQSTANYAKIKTFSINEEKTLPTGSSVLTITPPAGVTADIVKMLVLGSAWNNTYYAWNPQAGVRYMNTQNTWTFNANNMRGSALTTSTFFAVVLY